MNNNSYDFYSYGIRIANDMYENKKRLADEIEKKYGKDARLEFECGISIELNKKSFENMKNVVLDVKDESIGSNIVTANNLRNNSYFGGNGVSRQYDEDGNYIEPKLK